MILELLAIATVAAPALDGPYPPVMVIAPPQPPSDAKPAAVVTNPQWIRRPSGGDFANFYPPDSLRAGVDGHSSMECMVKNDGTLTDCRVISETPPGMGFGMAELRLASRFKMRPKTSDGHSVFGAKVVIPITWKIAAEPPPAPLPPPPDPAPH